MGWFRDLCYGMVSRLVLWDGLPTISQFVPKASRQTESAIGLQPESDIADLGPVGYTDSFPVTLGRLLGCSL